MAGRTFIEVDLDDDNFGWMVDMLRGIMKKEKFERAMYGVFRDTSRHVAAILRQDLPKHYYVQRKEITAVVKSPKLDMTGGQVNCSIPLTGRRKSIGGTYTASGSARGWESLRKKYRVTAKIVKDGASLLPQSLGEQGGQPPFRNIPSRLGKAAFTRSGPGFKAPIRGVVGLAVPQMPMNRSEEDVGNDIVDYAIKRLDQRINLFFTTGR